MSTSSAAAASNDTGNYWTTPVSAEQLKKFLVEAPAMFKYRLHRGAERQILTNCYRLLWGNDTALMQKYFFPDGTADVDNLSTLLEKHNLFKRDDDNTVAVPSNPDNVLVDPSNDEPEYWESQRGKQCGHIFKRGESVYRCRNCGLDDTCVMCSRCFHATNHEGHDVKIWISRGGGGCCDCGDPEAWKLPLECGIHSLSAAPTHETSDGTPPAQQLEPRSAVSPQLLEQIKATIQVVMDYILETFAASPENLSLRTKPEIQQECEASDKALGMPDNGNGPMYACILWNDEKHSFDQVIDVVMRATHCTRNQASKVAENVDAYGRHVIQTSPRLDELISIATEISRIQLAVTIRSCKDTVREEICGLLLDWLKDLINGPCTFFTNVQGGNCILRDIICQVLCEEYSLRPELAALSIRSRRGTMTEAELSFYDYDGTEDEGDDDEDGAMIIDDDNTLFLQQFGAPPDDVEWIEAGDDDDDEYRPGESDEDEDIDDSDDDEQHPYTAFEAQDIEMENADRESDIEDQLNASRHSRTPSAGNTTTSPPAHRSPRDDHHHTSAVETRSSSQRTPPHRRHSPSRMQDIIDLKYDLNEWLAYTERLELDERNIAANLGSPLPPNTKLVAENDVNIKKEFNRKLRLDYLLQYDLRLWKTARASIKDLLIGTLVSNYDYRPTIGIRFARNYPELLDAFFLKDREPEHSISSSLSVQLLTVPTVAALLVKQYKFFGIACSILANFFLTDNICMLLPEEYHNLQVNCASRAIRRPRFAFTFYDLRYVLNNELVKPEICLQPLYLRHFLDMLFQFQEMDPLIRSGNVHVEYESTTWVGAFNVTLQMSKLCRLFADCYASLSSNLPAVDATRSLCRSIQRILKALADWSPKLADPDTSNTGANENAGPLIKGIKEQQFQTIQTLHAGSFRVVKYDIAKELVSFHHPYHWLLAELLEHVSLLKDEELQQLGWSNGFKSVIDKFNEQNTDQDTFLTILEYPLRMRALLAQANCGVWVRNGFSIRNQARTYRDVAVRENTYDRDLYILQFGLVVTNPDHYLVTMIDRFNVTDWFNGKPDKAHPYYDVSQMTTIVEEFIDFLVICATERGYASDMNIEDKIRRAIIQYLGLSSMAYSELVKVLPDSLSDHEAFDKHLNSLSTYKPPAGLSDHGRYELKDEYYAEIDPYFWHFSRNQREEAFEKLRIRRNQNAAGSKKPEQNKEEFFVLPQLRKIHYGPFKHLGDFLQCHTFVQIILYALWNVRTGKSTSELILDDALYLAMVAVTDENNQVFERQQALAKGKFREDAYSSISDSNGFVQYATEDKYPITVGVEREHATLLTLLLRFLGDKDFKHIHQRCTFIVDKIYERGSNEAKEAIDEWRALHQKARETADAQESNDAGAEYEKKKAEAKARQASIMAQFAQAQSQFMSQYAEMYDDDDEDDMSDVDNTRMDEQVEGDGDAEVERTCHFPSGTCIVCQEELDRSRLYGVLGLVQKSKTVRQAPFDNSEVVLDVLETSQGRDTWKEHMEAHAQDSGRRVLNGFPTDAHVEGLHISTCGHLMHAHCFNGYQESVDSDTTNPLRALMPQLRHKQFLCPLCKALGNVLLPIVWKGKKESYPGPMATRTQYEELGNVAKGMMHQLESEIGPAERIPGSIDEDYDPRRDPTVEIEDLDGLRRLYNQLRTAMKGGHNSLVIQDGSVSPGQLRASLLELYNMYAYGISTLEIAQRGDYGVRARDPSVEHTNTFLDDISSQNQTLLKILAKTAELMPSVMNTRWVTDDRYTLQRISLAVLRQIFYDETSFADGLADSEIQRKPLLMTDAFETLTRVGFTTKSSSDQVDFHHFMRLLYLAEIAKTVIGLLQGLKTDVLNDPKIASCLQRLSSSPSKPEVAELARRFTCDVASLVGIPSSAVEDFFAQVPAHVLPAIIRTFALPYLRKSLVLMVVHHGFILQDQSWDEDDDDEYDHLVRILNLPSFSEIFTLGQFEQGMLMGWCRHYYSELQKDAAGRQSPPTTTPPNKQLVLRLPTPYYMVSLPYRMDQLFDASSRRVCRKCGSLPENPALCLICGTFVCARRYCCTENDRGECNTHAKSCSGDIGIFLVVKESLVLLLHADGGTIMNAPYLDTHGEVDLFLKRGTPQYLNPQRYEQIRQMWLSHSVPAYVRRKMESSYSYTRWESW